jgi:hypothetical protein
VEKGHLLISTSRKLSCTCYCICEPLECLEINCLKTFKEMALFLIIAGIQWKKGLCKSAKLFLLPIFPLVVKCTWSPWKCKPFSFYSRRLPMNLQWVPQSSPPTDDISVHFTILCFWSLQDRTRFGLHLTVALVQQFTSVQFNSNNSFEFFGMLFIVWTLWHWFQ